MSSHQHPPSSPHTRTGSTSSTGSGSGSGGVAAYTVSEAVTLLDGLVMKNPLSRDQRDRLSLLIRALDADVTRLTAQHATSESQTAEHGKTLSAKDSELLHLRLELQHRNKEIEQLNEQRLAHKQELITLRTELNTLQAEPAAQFDALGVKANLRGGKTWTFWGGVAVGTVLAMAGVAVVSKLVGWSWQPNPPSQSPSSASAALSK